MTLSDLAAGLIIAAIFIAALTIAAIDLSILDQISALGGSN